MKLYRRTLLVFLCSALLGLPAFLAASFWAKKTPPSENVWVVVRPIQCMGNPWEKEWLGRHKNRVDKYPRNKEFDVIKSFFKKKGAPVLDLRVQKYMKGDALCQTCSCPRGDTLYLLVNGDSALKMISLGFTERLPAEEVPKKDSSNAP